MAAIYFKGNAPPINPNTAISSSATVYYLPGMTGWVSTFGGLPTALWPPHMETTSTSAGQFGFNINWVSNQPVVVEVCTNLTNPVWFPLQTIILPDDSTDFRIYYSDSQWSSHPNRYYRLRSP